MSNDEARCISCGKLFSVTRLNESPVPNYPSEDGTYDPITNTYICTSCYVKLGAPANDSDVVTNLREKFIRDNPKVEYAKDTVLDYPFVNFLIKYLNDTGNRGIIAGGCFKDIFSHKKVKDIDVFTDNESNFKFINDKLSSNTDYVLSYNNDNVTAYRNRYTGITIEVIKKIYGKPNEILNAFDFSITKFALYLDNVSDNYPSVMYDNDFFKDITQKRLVLNNRIDYPLSTFNRLLRYTRYGYTLCKSSKVKLLKCVKNDYSNEELDASIDDGSFYEGVD